MIKKFNFNTNIVLLLTLWCTTVLLAQVGKDGDVLLPDDLEKVLGIEDRAGGTHNASNIGLFFENRGKLYPRRLTQGPSGEFPINSTKHYIYRVNQFAGIPGNVVQGRYTTNEEWEAIGGYHFRDSAQIAFSDNPIYWNPILGWPVKDENGGDLILSDQDSYCVFSDSNNTIAILGIQIAQTGYAYGVNFAKNILFFKYEITNNGSQDLEDFYFSLYVDCDIGNVSGGVPEYEDDRLDFIKEQNLVYFFDDGISTEWPDGKTGFFGAMFLKSPEINGTELGITDMHYNIYDDDMDIDTVQYGIMSSDPNLYNSTLGSKYFHIGNNPDLHYDDPATIPASGIDLLAYISSGPYTLGRNDTLVFITALVAGESEEEMLNAAATAQSTVDAAFQLPRPPVRPNLSGTAGDKKATLFWDDIAEYSLDEFSGNYDFEGYRLYRSIDKGINWDLLADYDVINSIGDNTGLQYSFTDNNIINGFEYWYSITSYDRGDAFLESLESPLGTNTDAINLVLIIPRSDAIGRTPVSVIETNHFGTGESNYLLNVNPIDDQALAGNEYRTSFSFISKKENGNLKTSITITITDSVQTKPYKYGIKFTNSSTFDVLNLTTDEVIRAGYNYPQGGRDIVISGHGLRISLADDPTATEDERPQSEDLIAIEFVISVELNEELNVIESRGFSIGQTQSTSDGIIFSLFPPEIIQSVSRIGGTDNVDITFSVVNESLVKDALYIISIDGNGTDAEDNGFVILSVTGSEIQGDTLYTFDTFEFDGIQGRIEFPSSTPPNEGNKFSLETVKPKQPDIRDRYYFRIEGAKVSNNQIAKDLNKIRVVPNPYVVSSLWEPEFGELRNEPLRQIQFINLPPECTIYIFTVDADLIKTIYHNSTNGTEVWDLRAEGGREIAAGVYIYLVKTKDTEHLERFAVIK
jgi:hypothetical protein